MFIHTSMIYISIGLLYCSELSYRLFQNSGKVLSCDQFFFAFGQSQFIKALEQLIYFGTVFHACYTQFRIICHSSYNIGSTEFKEIKSTAHMFNSHDIDHMISMFCKLLDGLLCFRGMDEWSEGVQAYHTVQIPDRTELLIGQITRNITE